MNQEKRSSTSVTLKGVVKFMAKHLICERISAGILEKDLLCATGCFVVRDSPGVTSYRDTGEPTQVSGLLRAWQLNHFSSAPVSFGDV